jgi:uncharacterized protein YjbI with pentapeptide repeats
MTGAHLHGADLDGANLSGAGLTGADLTVAYLRGVHYDEKTRWPGGFEPPPPG